MDTDALLERLGERDCTPLGDRVTACVSETTDVGDTDGLGVPESDADEHPLTLDDADDEALLESLAVGVVDAVCDRVAAAHRVGVLVTLAVAADEPEPPARLGELRVVRVDERLTVGDDVTDPLGDVEEEGEPDTEPLRLGDALLDGLPLGDAETHREGELVADTQREGLTVGH